MNKPLQWFQPRPKESNNMNREIKSKMSELALCVCACFEVFFVRFFLFDVVYQGVRLERKKGMRKQKKKVEGIEEPDDPEALETMGFGE